MGDGDYQWRIRAMDANLSPGTWIYFGGNANGTPPAQPAAIDFTIDTTGGTGGTGYPQADGTIGTGHISSMMVRDVQGTVLMSNDSGDTGYADYTTTPGLDLQLQPGQSYTIGVQALNTSAGYACWVWVDWNSDLDFDDAGELLPLVDTTGAGDSFAGTFTVPATATPGETCLRLRLWDGSVAGSPTGTFATGEVEDYRATIPGAVNADPAGIGGSSGGNCGGSIAGGQFGSLVMSGLAVMALFLLLGIRRRV